MQSIEGRRRATNYDDHATAKRMEEVPWRKVPPTDSRRWQEPREPRCRGRCPRLRRTGSVPQGSMQWQSDGVWQHAHRSLARVRARYEWTLPNMPHDVALGPYPSRTGAGDIHHAAQEGPLWRHGELSCDLPPLPLVQAALGRRGTSADGGAGGPTTGHSSWIQVGSRMQGQRASPQMFHQHGPPGRQTSCRHLHRLQCCVWHREPVIPRQCPSGNRARKFGALSRPHSLQQQESCALDNRTVALRCRNHLTSREACCRGISSRQCASSQC